MEIQQIVENQRAFYATRATMPLSFRLNALQTLQQSIRQNEQNIFNALHEDLGKAALESYMTEVGMVLEEIRFAIKHLKNWQAPRKVRTPLAQFYGKSFIVPEPYGVALIMSPWNYPFLLTMEPLIGALAAGNCVILKPSNYSHNTSNIIADIIHRCFPAEYVEVVLGGRQQNTDLLNQRFDYIFFTGSVTVGRLVLESAVPGVTPVTLELGGKSPCIVDSTADIALAAKRIAFGKFLNAGQTCVAPDYVYVHSSKQQELVSAVNRALDSFFPWGALTDPEYPRIINQKHFDRLSSLLTGAHIVRGGETDPASLRIAPTLLTNTTWDDPVMQQEIFGPILPILTFNQMEEVIQAVNAHPKPLALYLFTTDPAVENQVVTSVAYGGGCINDTVIHLATTRMPFGGVGFSGMGSYHGKKSFDTFTHDKSIVKKANWIDLPMRYHPYTKKHFKAIRRFMH